MSRITNHIDCDNCGTLTETKIRKIELTRYGQVFTVDAETETCPQCDNFYLHRKAVDEAEKKIDLIIAPV